MNKQVVTISFFKYKGLQKIWGMQQNLYKRWPLSRTKGLSFFKLFGSGGYAGYSLRPDFSRFGLLAVWENESIAKEFLDTSKTFQQFKNHSVEQYTIFMHPYSSKGTWSGKTPLIPGERDEKNSLVSVITRATVKFGYLKDFWKQVPNISDSHENVDGLLLTKGFGEIPVLEMATFSVWESEEQMVAFAYKSHYHPKGIKKTRARDGFSEEMYARFQPFETKGTWNGEDPIGEKLNHKTSERS